MTKRKVAARDVPAVDALHRTRHPTFYAPRLHPLARPAWRRRDIAGAGEVAGADGGDLCPARAGVVRWIAHGLRRSGLGAGRRAGGGADGNRVRRCRLVAVPRGRDRGDRAVRRRDRRRGGGASLSRRACRGPRRRVRPVWADGARVGGARAGHQSGDDARLSRVAVHRDRAGDRVFPGQWLAAGARPRRHGGEPAHGRCDDAGLAQGDSRPAVRAGPCRRGTVRGSARQSVRADPGRGNGDAPVPRGARGTRMTTRTILSLALAAGLGACAAPGAVGPTVSRPVVPYTSAGLERVIGQDAAGLVRLFGQPDADIREGAARKLQFAGPICVLDAYLYPKENEGPRVTYLDAREPDGSTIDRASCVAALTRREGGK